MAGSDRIGVGEALAKGALAGVIGGMAMAMTTAAEQKALLGEMGPSKMPPVKLVQTEAEKRGVELSTSQAIAAGMGAHLMYSALLGAAFGLVQSRLKGPMLLDGLVFAGLAYAAGYSKSGIMPRAGATPPPMEQPIEKAAIPVASHAAFGIATAMAFEQLT